MRGRTTRIILTMLICTAAYYAISNSFTEYILGSNTSTFEHNKEKITNTGNTQLSTIKNNRHNTQQTESSTSTLYNSIHDNATAINLNSRQDPDILKIMADREKSNKPIQDPDAFLERLNEIKKNNIKEKELQNAGTVYFSTIQPSFTDAGAGYTSVFSPLSLRIYAIFILNTPPLLGDNSVLVKWHNSSKELLLFEYVTINPQSNVNYVWRENPIWSPGYYNVDIYRADETMTLLASGSYEIQDLNEYLSSIALYNGIDYGYSLNSFTANQKILIKLNYSSFIDKNLRLKITELGDNSTLYEQIFLLPAAYKWHKLIYLDDYVSTIPAGTYQLDAIDETEQIVARSIFYLLAE